MEERQEERTEERQKNNGKKVGGWERGRTIAKEKQQGRSRGRIEERKILKEMRGKKLEV